MLVRHAPDRECRERGAPVQPAPPPPLAAVLALQRSAGNAAVARLLQRSPGTFAAATTEIVKLAPGRAKTSFWPPVVDRTTEYGLLAADHGPRLAKLVELEQAIQA